MADLNVVVEKLQSFETADDLADYFKQYGIKASPQKANACAISVFVEIETGEVGNIMTSTRELSLRETLIDDDGYEYEVSRAEFQHSHAMAQFVRKFDSGKYPFLIEDNAQYDYEYNSDDGYCFCVTCRPDDQECPCCK